MMFLAGYLFGLVVGYLANTLHYLGNKSFKEKINKWVLRLVNKKKVKK